MIRRDAERYLKKLASGYAVISITGPRQSGKTTLARMVFDDRPYVSLENPDVLEAAESDTRSFLKRYENGAVFDEAQRCPRLFSFMQEIIDRGEKKCRYVLTGSQQFGLMSKITQSLAGRVANCTLLPFSYAEWYREKKTPRLETVLFRGQYPPVLDRSLDPSTWHANYVRNYIERDVRQLASIQDLRTFHLFLRMCASRTGQLLNLSGLASDCGIAVNTAKSWISILEASYIIFLLQPYFDNFGKRLVKTPKLYFYDTGLCTYLLGLDNEDSLSINTARGQLFESFAIGEMKKAIFNSGAIDTLYFWRNKSGLEIDAVLEKNATLTAIEIRSGRTVSPDYFSAILSWKRVAGKTCKDMFLVYGGDEPDRREGCTVVPWRNIADILS
jgi:uncharacterized protein